jgi:membrane protease YdiL (CAAX protease family)
MSGISFLENARTGENNILRYILTILLTWGTPIIFQIIIIIYAMSFLISQGTDMENLLTIITTDPLVLIALVGVTSIVSLIFLYIGVRFIHKRRFISLISTDSRFNWKKLLKGGGVWFAILTASTVIALIFDPTGLEFTFNPSTFILLLVLSLLVFPIQASFEELFFRGYLMQGFGLLSRKPVVPLIITSVIFSLLHYFNGSYTLLSVDIVLQVFVLGLTLGIITLGENRLETAMGVHISNNIFASLIVNSPDNFGSNMPSIFTNFAPPDPLYNTLGMVVYALVLLVVIFWGKKDNLIRIFRTGE